MSEDRVPTISDKELIERARSGDIAAFGELYKRYAVTIYRYIRSRVEEESVAEDMTEAVFLKSFEAIDRYRDKGYPYSAYLYRVAKNMLVDHYRDFEDVIALEDVAGEESKDRLDDLVIRDEEKEHVVRTVESLSEDYQEVIRLRVVMELSTSETAEWMGRSAGAVRVLLHRALVALREKLEDEGT